MKRYTCNKEKKEIITGKINLNNKNGYKVKPKTNLEYDGIEVGEITLIEPYLIERVLKKKYLFKFFN